MLFSGLSFIFIFLPVFLAAYIITGKKYRNITLLIGSVIFYAIGEPKYVILLLISLFLNYFFYKCMAVLRVAERRGGERFLFVITILLNVGNLFFFKYLGFVLENIAPFLSGNAGTMPDLQILLPLGISFYTFQILSFQIDRYRGQVGNDVSFVCFAAYITMFPQLIAGPIVKYGEVGNEMVSRKMTLRQMEEGLMIFCVGLGLKVLIANNIGTLWSTVAQGGGASLQTSTAWLGAAAYSFQIYFDFFGYSVMAIGLAKIMGFQVPENFKTPYESRSISEFWRRWHITMGRFFREYVYFPLGGSRHGLLRTIFNLFVVWALTGFWHGADWNFLLWGLVFFVLISIEKLGIGKWLERTKVLGHIVVIVIIPVTWVIFALPNMNELSAYLQAMFGMHPEGAIIREGQFMRYISEYWWLLLICVIFSTRLPQFLYRKFNKTIVVKILVLIVFILSCIEIQRGSSNPFMYFRF